LEALETNGVIGVGHSLGGVTTLLAAVRRPDLFQAVVLLDPVLLPPCWLALMRWVRRLRLPWHPPMVERALRRRRVWPNREAAYEYFKEKPLFASWHDAALRAYVESGTRSRADGQVELVYPPEWEAYLFDSVPTDVWRIVSRMNPGLPVLILRGERSTTLRPKTLAHAARLLPHARFALVPEAGHMFPLERPAETAAHIRAFLS
jgi:pimeloyl-ACP methyl ester carboxylesterase